MIKFNRPKNKKTNDVQTYEIVKQCDCALLIPSGYGNFQKQNARVFA